MGYFSSPSNMIENFDGFIFHYPILGSISKSVSDQPTKTDYIMVDNVIGASCDHFKSRDGSSNRWKSKF